MAIGMVAFAHTSLQRLKDILHMLKHGLQGNTKAASFQHNSFFTAIASYVLAACAPAIQHNMEDIEMLPVK